MAKQTPLDRLNKRYGVKNTKSSTEKTTTDKIQSQIDNYKTRLSNIGKNPEDVTDTRNWLEKQLNLEKDQNVLFDILEIINRPQNALLTGINNALSGESFGEGLKEGILGETKTTGKDILVDQLGMEDRTGKIDASDILGFGVDLLTDPLDWALIPVTGGASKAAEVSADAARIASKVDDVADAAKGVKFISGYDALGKLAGKGIKSTGKLADKVIEGTLGAMDNRTKNLIEKTLGKSINDATASELAKVTRELGKSPDKLELYRNLKKGAKNIVDSSKNLGGLVGKSREVEGTSELLKRGGKFQVEALDNEARSIADTIATRTGRKADDVYDDIAKSINTVVDAQYDWTIRGDEILDDLAKGKKIDLFTNNQAKQLVDELNNYGLKSNIIDNRYVKLADGKKNLNQLKDAFSAKTFGKRLSDADYEDIKKATKFIEDNPELNDFFARVDNSVKDISKSSDAITGLNTQALAKEGYVPHVLTDDAKQELKRAGGSNNQFNTRKYQMTANEANRQKEALTLAKKEATGKSLEAKNEIIGFAKDKEGNLIIDKDNLPKKNEAYISEMTNKKKANIEGLKNDLVSAEEIQKLKAGKDIDVTKLNKKDARTYKISNTIKDYDNTISELKKRKFSNIPEEHSDIIKDVRTSINDYKKANTRLINAIRNGADEDTIKKFTSEVAEYKKAVTVQVKRADVYANKTSIKAMNKAFKEGKELGKELQSAMTAKVNNTKMLNELFEANGDHVTKLRNAIETKQTELKNFLKSSDKVWNKQVDSLIKLDEAYRDLASKEGQQFFKTNFFDNITEYVNRNAEFTKGAKIYNDALASSIFDNPEYVKYAENLKDGKIPYGFQKVNGTYIKNKLSKYEGILPDNAKESKRILSMFEGKDVYMDKQLVNMLNIGSKTGNELNPLLKLWDGMNNAFKKFSTITPGFQMRNIIGNSTDMVLSGVNPAQLPSYYKKAHAIWNNADDLIAKAAKGTLDEAEQKQFKILEQFYKGGFADALKEGYGLEDVAKKVANKTKNPINWASRKSINMNEKVDAYNRLTLLLYANDNPKYLEKLGKKNAIDAVKYVLFDPRNLSDAEKSFKRVVPFYTFTKQNLLFQSTNALKNTGRYSKLYKALRDGYNDLDEGTYNAYQKNAMQIPIPFTNDNGEQLFLKTNLPLSDLGEFLSSPVQRTVASLSPVIKTPIEMTTGKNLFTGNDSNYTTLSSSRLSKKLNDTLDRMGMSTTGITKVEDAADLILNNFGLQNVSTNLVKKVESILDNADGTKSGQQMWAEIFRSILQNTKEESIKNSGLYDELQAYQAEIERLKNQGIDVPTIKEINAGNKIKLNNLKRKRARSS